MRALVVILGLAACVPIPVPIPMVSVSAPQVRTLAASSAPDAGFDAQLTAARGRPIAHNAQLAAVARAHAADMARRGYFSHNSPEGSTSGGRASTAGVPACGIGENIAQGQTSSTQVFAGWMASGGHRRNMLNPRMASYGLGRSGDTWVLMLYQPC
ncbi:MAG: hypothetical protein ACI9TA_000935 [Reinekea sp.]|jgi:uncharacterized protein YkwD